MHFVPSSLKKREKNMKKRLKEELDQELSNLLRKPNITSEEALNAVLATALLLYGDDEENDLSDDEP
jgi:hypothetical protein